MKRTYSLRMQLFGLMALLVALQSLALVLALFVSQVFSMLDAEAFRLFSASINARVQNYNTSIGQLVGNMAQETTALNQTFNSISAEHGISAGEIYQNNLVYAQASMAGADTLLDILRTNRVSGAFFVLNGSNTRPDDPNAHSVVYIRNSAPNSTTDSNNNYLLEFGPIDLSQQLGIPTSIHWNLDISIQDIPGPQTAYYQNPIWAATQEKRAEMERYGYWSSPVDVWSDGQDDIIFTLPLLDAQNNPYGVLGIEISMPLFSQHYLPSAGLPYQNSFFAIVPASEDNIRLDWFIPSNAIAQVYLKQGDTLNLDTVGRSGLFGTHLQGLGDMYCSVHPLTIYSRNSPFFEERWMLVGLVPKNILHETSRDVRIMLALSIAATTAISFAAIFLLTYFTTRKISGLSAYVQSLAPYMDIHFKPTKIKEIDELTAAVQRLNKSVVNASKTTSKILELTLLPIGGYEVSSEVRNVILTEYLYELLSIPPGQQVSKEEWEDIRAKLLARPVPQGYDDVYQFGDDAHPKWLRILETPTPTGKVGVILDVSKEVEERRRLAHELDYDALTRLLNRMAFKRQAHQLILTKPNEVGVMVFADLDNLKYINDTFGHDMGDRLIMRAGEMFRSFEKHGGVVSRISGDEFAIYLHGFSSKEDAAKLVFNQYQGNADYSLETPDGQLQKIRCSSGIAYYPEDSDNVTDLLKLADFAMYEAKHNRKGSIYEFNKESYQRKAYLLENREAINRLLDEGLIRFAFQPIVDLKTGEIFAYEALMRPMLDNFKSPGEILAVAESQSKSGQLERLVMMTAFEFVKKNLHTLGDIKVFVNSIPSQMMGIDDHLLLQKRYPDTFSNIVIEITEAENDIPEILTEKAEFIRRLGIGIAIDDYGSGFSNEMRILSFNADIVKIDMSLVSGINANEDKRILVSNLVSFCRPKGIRLVAEGVETREELAALVDLGVDFVQGYYILRPQFELSPIPDKVKKEILYLQHKNQ